MKHVQTLLYSFVLLLSLFSCNHGTIYEKLPLLTEIQLLGDTLPTQALLKLDSIKPFFNNESEYMRNKLALLNIRLHDKAFILHTSDSIIKQLCRYFEKNGTAAELQEAYYYMGSVYRDLNDYPNAVTAFLKAIDVAESNKDADTYILQTSYTQLAYLYSELFDQKEALEAMVKGLNVAEANCNATDRTYMSVAGFYYDLKDTANTILYCTKAMEFVKKEGICKDNADLVAKAMSSFAKCGYKDDAVSCFNMLNTLKENERPHNYLSAISVYYEECVSVDSAAIIKIKQFEKSGNIETLYNVTKWLTVYYSNKGDYENATKYAVLHIRINNTLIKNRNIEGTDKARNIFQYKRDKEKELEIIKKSAQDRYNLLLGISVSLLLLFGGIIFHYHCKKRLLDIILSKEENIRQAKAMVVARDAELEKEKKDIEQKERELISLSAIKSELTKQLEVVKNDKKILSEQNGEFAKHNIMRELSADAESIVKKLKDTSKGKAHLSDEDWKELLAAIDKLYPEFIYELQAKFKKINEPMLRVCYLWKIKCTNPEIVKLTGYPPQTIWDRVKRIKEALGNNR